MIDLAKKAIVIIRAQQVGDFRPEAIETFNLVYSLEVVQDHSGELVGFRPPLSFEVAEEETPVFLERSSESCSVLVLPQRWIGPRQQGAGVEGVIHPEKIGRAVKIVRTGLGDDIHETSEGAAVFGGECVV